MGIVENIRSLQMQGIGQEEIVRTLQSQGFQLSEINDAMSQAKIKDAVSTSQESSSTDISTGEMQPSISAQQASAPLSTQLAIDNKLTAPQPQQPYQQDYSAQPQAYQDYGYGYSSGVSPDTINEIAEQVMLENLTPLKDKLEQALEFRNITETKINYIDERLKRIEKTIDRLQLSVLQKVGDYITNVEDIKKEIQETQKTFKVMALNTQSSQTSPSQSTQQSKQKFS